MAVVGQPNRSFCIKLTGLKVQEEGILGFFRECLPGTKIDVGDIQHEDAQRTSAKVCISGIISSEEKRLLEDGYKTVCEECIIVDTENAISAVPPNVSQDFDTSVGPQYTPVSSQSSIMNPYMLQDPTTGIHQVMQLPFNSYAVTMPSNQHFQSLQPLSSPLHASPLTVSESNTTSLPPMGSLFVPYYPGVSLPMHLLPHSGSQSSPRMVSQPLTDSQLVTASQLHSSTSVPIPQAQVKHEDSLIDLDPCPISDILPKASISSEGLSAPEILQDVFSPDYPKSGFSHQPKDLTFTLSPAVQTDSEGRKDTSIQSLKLDESIKSTDELIQISTVKSDLDGLPAPSFLDDLWTSVTSTSTVRVESTNALNKENLQMVFDIEDDGGGEIEPNGIIMKPSNQTALVTFKEISVARNVAKKGKWDVMGVTVHVTLHSKRGTPVKDVLKKVVYEPHTTVVVGNISYGITEEYLRTFLEHHTGLTFYQMQSETTPSNSTDDSNDSDDLCDSDDSDVTDSSGSSVHKEYNACLFVSHPLALVVLSSDVLKTDGRKAIIDKVHKKKIKNEGKTSKLSAEEFPPIKAIILGQVKRSSYKDKYLKTYFKNPKSSGGGPVDEVEIDAQQGRAMVTFKDTKAVLRVLERDHSERLGDDVSVYPYHPIFEKWFHVEQCSDGYAKESEATQKHPFRIPVKPNIARFLEKKAIGFPTELTKIFARANLEKDSVLIEPLDGSDWIQMWDEHCNKIVQEHLLNYSEIVIPLDEESEWAYKLVVDLQGEDKVDAIKRDTQLVIVGEAHAVQESKEKASRTAKEHALEVKTELVDHHVLVYIKHCLYDQLTQDHGKVSQLSLDLYKNEIKFAGEERHCTKLLHYIHRLNPPQVVVKVPKSVVQIFTTNGKNLLDSLLQSESKVSYYFTDDDDKSPESEAAPVTKLCLVGESMRSIELLAQKIEGAFVTNNVKIPQEFEVTEIGDEWFSFKRSIESEYIAGLHVELPKEQILLTCQPNRLRLITSKLEAFIKAECYLDTKVHLEQGQWQYLEEFKEWVKFTVELEKFTEEGKLTCSLPKVGEPNPQIVLRGYKSVVQSIVRGLQKFKEGIYHSTFEVGKPGAIKRFTSPEGEQQLEGIASRHKAIIKTFTQEEHDADCVHEEPMHVVVCSGSYQRNAVDIAVGDITEFEADAIVNAANESLNHSGGLAGTIRQKGGSIVQEDSKKYVDRKGKVDVGDAVLLKKCGNLPCKALIHAVAPKWDRGENVEEIYLQKAVTKSLKLAVGHKYRSIAIPALGTGIYKVPKEVCARATFQGIKMFSEQNPSADIKITIVLFSMADAPPFISTAKHYLHQVICPSEVTIPSAEVSHISPSQPRSFENRDSDLASPHKHAKSGRSSLSQPKSITGKKGPSVSPLNRIHLSRGELARAPADIFVNTTSQDLDLSQGAVAKSLLQAGGAKLQDSCTQYIKTRGDHIPIWDIATTGPGKLQCKHVIHTVGGNYDGLGGSSEKNMASMIHKVLKECDKLKAGSVAFPALGTGNLRFPNDRAAHIMVQTICEYFQANPASTIKSVKLIIFMKDTHQAFLKQLQSVRDPNSSAPKGFANIPNLTIQIVNGNIADQQCDGLVNTTNAKLALDKVGVQGALLQRGGQELQDECTAAVNEEGELVPGKIIITGPGKSKGLACRRILHICPPDLKKISEIRNIVVKILQKADEIGLTSISLPAIGTGSHKLPVKLVASLYCEAVTAFNNQNREALCEVRIVIADQANFTAFSEHFSMEGKQKGMTGAFFSGVWKSVTSAFAMLTEFDDDTSVRSDRFKPITLHEKTVVLPPTDSSNTIVSPTQSPYIGTGYSKVQEGTGYSNTNILIISVYAGSQDAVSNVMKDVEAAVDKHLVRDKKEHPKVDRLYHLTNYRNAMEQKSLELQVQYTIDPDPLNVVKLKGDRYDVQSMLRFIDNILYQIELEDKEEVKRKEKAQLLQLTCIWQWKNAFGHFENYNPDVNLEIEEAYGKNPEGGISCQVGQEKFTIDFATMQETKGSISCVVKRRDIQKEREEFEKEIIEGKKAAHWDPMPFDEETHKEAVCHTIALDSASKEYNAVLEAFEETMTNGFPVGDTNTRHYTAIKSIKRIQNPKLYSQYIARKKQMDESNPPGHQNERKLFHGCAVNAIESINHGGFNRSFCGKNATYLGDGMYFSGIASYSAQPKYSEPDENKDKYMYYARVLTGMVTKGQQGLKVPPPRDPSNPHVLYDSTSFDPDNPTLFAVFYDAQAYPEYLITFN
jgi:poly [ADP-ribose] polymerase 10/14/15